MTDDIVTSFMGILLDMSPNTPTAEAMRIEAHLRQQWGGARVYVCKAPSLERKLRVAEPLASGAPPREAFVTAGVGRSWGYELLKRRWSR